MSVFFGGAAFASHGTDVEPGEDTLQEAVEEAEEGDTLILERGVYLVTGTIVIDKSLTIRGETGDPEDVHIVAVDAEEFDFNEAEFPDPLDQGHILFVTSDAEEVSFKYFTIKNAPEVDVDEVFCTDENVGLGLNLSECFGDAIHSAGAREIKVKKVIASLNAGNGIWVDGAEKAKFDHILAINNGAFGIDVDTALYLEIEDSSFIANQISGVEAAGHVAGTLREDYTAEVSIENTLASSNGEIGIEVERFEDAKLKYVTCSDNKEDGFDADRVSRVRIDKSSFVNNLDDGLELFPVDDVPEDEQPDDFPGNIIVEFKRLEIEGNVGEPINFPDTEN